MAEGAPLAVGVVTRTRDRHDGLLAVAASLKAQTRKPDEWVVVDDGSIEAVDVRLLQEASGLEVVLVRHDTSAGRAGAAQAGLETASADALLLLDDDDTLLPDALEALAAALSPDTVAAAGGCRFTSGETDELSPAGAGVVDLSALARRNTLVTAATLFRRDAALEAGGIDRVLPALEDWDLWLRLALRGDIAIVDRICALVHSDPEDASRTSESDHAEGLVMLRNKWLRADVAAGRTAISDTLPNADSEALAEAQALARRLRRIAFWKR